jgi:hypothetical protein
VVREAKGLAPSAWVRANGGSRKIHCAEIAGGRYRAVDPWLRIEGRIAVRRLSPNNRKIEADDGIPALLAPQMLETMGLDLAGAHVGANADGCAEAILADLGRRKRGWLLASAQEMAAAVRHDHAQWQAGSS